MGIPLMWEDLAPIKMTEDSMEMHSVNFWMSKILVGHDYILSECLSECLYAIYSHADSLILCLCASKFLVSKFL